MKSFGRFGRIAAVCLAVAATSARAEDEEETGETDVEGAKDHPAFPRYPGSVMIQHDEREFESFKLPAGKKQKTPVAVFATCEQDLKEANLVVVEQQAMEQVVEITADALADELEKSGHVAVYGIEFASGKAEITPASARVLGEIGKLLDTRAGLRLRVEGHTDNVGKAAANLELSKKRAAAVKAWLVRESKVEGKRLTTEGFGDKKPLAPNTTDEGRGKNRRDELVKL